MDLSQFVLVVQTVVVKNEPLCVVNLFHFWAAL